MYLHMPQNYSVLSFSILLSVTFIPVCVCVCARQCVPILCKCVIVSICMYACVYVCQCVSVCACVTVC